MIIIYYNILYIRPGSITITLPIIAFQRTSVELQLHLQGQLQLQLLSNFIGLKLQLNY